MKMLGKTQFFFQNICVSRRKVLLLSPINEKRRQMLNRNAYFYGYYFYFAGTCEAEGRM